MDTYYNKFYKFKDSIEDLFSKKKDYKIEIRNLKDDINKTIDDMYGIRVEIEGLKTEKKSLLGKDLVLKETIFEILKENSLFFIILMSIVSIVCGFLLMINVSVLAVFLFRILAFITIFLFKSYNTLIKSYNINLRLRKIDVSDRLKEVRNSLSGLEFTYKEKEALLIEYKDKLKFLNSKLNKINDRIELNHNKIINLTNETKDLLNVSKKRMFDDLLSLNKDLNKLCEEVKIRGIN